MRSRLLVLVCLLIPGVSAGCSGPARPASSIAAGNTGAPQTPGAIRFTGLLEAVRSRTIAAPRLTGTPSAMIITFLAKPGTWVKEGDRVLAFDPQEQTRLANDKRAEVVDLESQIDRKKAEQAAAEAKDQTGIIAAENDVERAKLAVATNDLIAKVAAEKNSLTLEQNVAKLEQLRATFKLKREAAAADLQILEIRRERAQRALSYAELNSSKMEVLAPFPGLIVVKTTYKQGRDGQVEIIEGDEVRPGIPVIDIVDTSTMQVRARVNQADAQSVRQGQSAVVRLDGFPELRFKGRVDLVTPLATTGMSTSVRTFITVVSVEGSHPQLLPDLTASVEVIPEASTPPATAGKGGK